MDTKLIGVTPELDQFINDLGSFSRHLALKGYLPANAGNASFVMGKEGTNAVLSAFHRQTELISFEHLAELKNIRHDGRTYYNAESVPIDSIKPLIRDLAGKVVPITATGAKLWDVDRNPDKRLCLLEINQDADGFYLLFGNKEYGIVPSIETLTHLVANTSNLRNGLDSSAALHTHPPHLVAVNSHIEVNNSYAELNKIVYTQKEGVLTNVSDLIGVVPYQPSGSKALLSDSFEAINNHRFTLWSHHGAFIRERTIERCVDLLEYVEDAATAALRSLLNPNKFVPLSDSDIEKVIKLYNLKPDLLDILRSDK